MPDKTKSRIICLAKSKRKSSHKLSVSYEKNTTNDERQTIDKIMAKPAAVVKNDEDIRI